MQKIFVKQWHVKNTRDFQDLFFDKLDLFFKNKILVKIRNFGEKSECTPNLEMLVKSGNFLEKIKI